MQFADPEWQPPEERELNTNPQVQKMSPPQPINAYRGEQPQWQSPPLPEGYLGPGYAGSQPQTSLPGRSTPTLRRRSSPWRWIIFALIIIALMSGAFSRGFSGYGGPGPQQSFPRGQTQSFAFNGASTIIINGGSGDINVHTGGSGSSVNIQETTNDGPFGNSGNAIVKPTQNGNTISVSEDQGSDTSFDVTVPSNENLTLTTTDGSITVNGVNGQMTLQSSNGDITANNDVLTGSSSLSSNNGGVAFSGSIDAGNYQFHSTNGSVDLTLPSNSNLQVNASTSSGSINSDFSSVNPQSQGNGAVAHGNVGNSSQAAQTQVTLTSDSGDINLHAAS